MLKSYLWNNKITFLNGTVKLNCMINSSIFILWWCALAQQVFALTKVVRQGESLKETVTGNESGKWKPSIRSQIRTIPMEGFNPTTYTAHKNVRHTYKNVESNATLPSCLENVSERKWDFCKQTGLRSDLLDFHRRCGVYTRSSPYY